MSHRDDCPSRWQAKREGERAFDNGLGSWRNPYREDWPDQGCPEAQRAWCDGFRDAERREEERQIEAAQERAHEQRRREEAMYEEMYQQAQQEEQYPEPEYPEQEELKP
jgi:hypothetical protein